MRERHLFYSTSPLLPKEEWLKTALKRIPALHKSMEFEDVVYTIELCITSAIDAPYSYEQLKGNISTLVVQPLVESLLDPKEAETGSVKLFSDQHQGIVAALLVARADFLNMEQEDLITGYIERGLAEARATVAEMVAARFLYHVRSDNVRIAMLTYECEQTEGNEDLHPSEHTPLLRDFPYEYRQEVERKCCIDKSIYEGCSTIELAVNSDAREFLCSGPVESVVNRIWNGSIVFFDRIRIGTERSAHRYSPNNSNSGVYARLRVPRFRAFFMMMNYAVLLILFYALLFKQQQKHRFSRDTSVTWVETTMHIWFVGLIVDELTQIREAGSVGRYLFDYWTIFDMMIIMVYLIYCVLRYLGHASVDYRLTQSAFDVLSLEALLLIPRFFSFVSVYPYFGTLLPCLKQLAKELIKFLSLIAIIYLSFFTCFTFLARKVLTIREMSWLLVSVFFGNAAKGFEAAPRISPEFGPALMLVFITLSNLILIPILVSILSSRFNDMMQKAREEYVFLFSSTVIEHVTTAERLTYFYPPMNIITFIIRPLRLFCSTIQYKKLKLFMLRLTHFPLAWAIKIYEKFEHAYLVHKHRRLLQRRNSRNITVT